MLSLVMNDGVVVRMDDEDCGTVNATADGAMLEARKKTTDRFVHMVCVYFFFLRECLR